MATSQGRRRYKQDDWELSKKNGNDIKNKKTII